MTSPRLRKKKLRSLALREKKNNSAPEVATAPPPVVESEPVVKVKKSKNALVETKSQDQVVEQQKLEVKTETIEEKKLETKE